MCPLARLLRHLHQMSFWHHYWCLCSSSSSSASAASWYPTLLFQGEFSSMISTPMRIVADQDCSFWRSWMYWLSPFKYLLEGMLGLIIHDIPVNCDDSELAKFQAPPGQSCQSYAGPYTQQAGGYVTELGNGLCGFCQYASGDEFGASFNVYFEVCFSPQL